MIYACFITPHNVYVSNGHTGLLGAYVIWVIVTTSLIITINHHKSSFANQCLMRLNTPILGTMMKGDKVCIASDSDGSITENLGSNGIRYSVMITKRENWGPLPTPEAIAMIYFQIVCFLKVCRSSEMYCGNGPHYYYIYTIMNLTEMYKQWGCEGGGGRGLKSFNFCTLCNQIGCQKSRRRY